MTRTPLESRPARVKQLVRRPPFALILIMAGDVHDALHAARDARLFTLVTQVANNNDLLICAICFRARRLIDFTIGGCTRVHDQQLGSCILCDNCYGTVYGESLKDRKLRFMREDSKRFRR